MRRLFLLLLLSFACSKAPSYNDPPPSDCTPSCDGKVCGIDGCGGFCGECEEGEVCAVGGVCVPQCVPDCSERNCAGDGCGGSCGTCVAPNPLCSPTGRCVDCLPDCEGRICGDDGCGGSCGDCEPFATCTSTGTCDCNATCGNRECGVVCEDFCGDCGQGEICNAMGMCEVCTPDCTGRVCGDDGCGGTCGMCPNRQRCTDTGMCEDCMCGSAECSDDGCCGFCPAGNMAQLECSTAGLCTCNPGCTPDCTDRVCGPDGCGGTCGGCGATERCTFNPTMNPTIDCRPFAGVSGEMNFFVSSEGSFPNGGNFVGYVGADALCQRLANEVGAGGRTWVAYLSATGTAARDRIGMGPWRNAAGVALVDPTCASTNTCVDLLHIGNVPVGALLTENGESLDLRNARVVFTGSDAMGRPTTMDCMAWTSSDESMTASAGQVDAARLGGAARWNSGVSVPCGAAAAACAESRAHVYCFSP